MLNQNFDRLFGLKAISGKANQSLSRPNAIVISEKIANQFFGRPDVAGETLSVATEGYGNKFFEITAVIETLGKNNSVADFMNMDAQVFLPMSSTSFFSLGTPDLYQWPVALSVM
ncbi:MAG: ABC transporter permease [Chryseolinea sp.]